MQRRNWTIWTPLEGTKLLMQWELTPGNEAQVWDHTPEDWPAIYRRFLHYRYGLLSSLYYREKCAQGSPLFWLLISVRFVYPNRFSLILSIFDNGPVTVEVTLGFAKSSLLITTFWLGFWVKPLPAFVCAILLCGWSHCLLGGLKSILTFTQITESTDRKTWYSSLPLVVCSVIKNVYCIVSYVRHFNYDWKKWFHDNTIAATLGHLVCNYSALHSHIKECLCVYSCQRCHARHPFSCENEKSRTLPKVCSSGKVRHYSPVWNWSSGMHDFTLPPLAPFSLFLLLELVYLIFWCILVPGPSVVITRPKLDSSPLSRALFSRYMVITWLSSDLLLKDC